MKIINRRFNRDYQKIESYEAGIILTGPEVKSIKEGRLKLEEAYVKIINNEAYLINAQIPLYQFANVENYDPKRTRKLLLKKKEITRLMSKLKSSPGLTIAPVSCYNKGDLLKLEIALVRGRKEIEKKKLEKEKDIKREQEKEIKNYLKRG
jgi:SsrA-binding protein